MSKRIALVTTGAVLTVGGLTLTAVGAGVLAAFGTDSTIATGHHRVSTGTSALVSERGDFGGPDAGTFGRTTVKVSVRDSDRPVFVGVGRAADVDRFLAGAAVEQIDDLELRPFDLDTTVRPGTAEPGSPLEQDFWIARSVGTDAAETTWRIRDGSYRLVVMNADGSAGVDVAGRVGVRVPYLTPIGTALLAGGGLTALTGAVLLVAGIRTRPDRPAPAVAAPTLPQPVAAGRP